MEQAVAWLFGILNILFSSRVWVPLVSGTGLFVTFRPLPEWLDPNHLIIAALAVAVVTILLVSIRTYDVEGVNEYVLDIAVDGFFTMLATVALTVVVTGHFISDWSLSGLWFLIIGAAIGAIDLGVSLKGGASKLLEMDKAKFSGSTK